MIQTPPSIRQLAEELTAKIEAQVVGNFYCRNGWDSATEVIESALLTLAHQVREEDARIAEDIVNTWTRGGIHNTQPSDIAAAIRARQETRLVSDV